MNLEIGVYASSILYVVVLWKSLVGKFLIRNITCLINAQHTFKGGLSEMKREESMYIRMDHKNYTNTRTHYFSLE